MTRTRFALQRSSLSSRQQILEGRRIDPSFYPVIYGLDDGDDWNDHQALYDYGFDTLSMEKPEKSGEEFSVTVVGGSSGKAMLTAGEPPLVCRGVGESEITTRCELAPFVYAPVEKGQKLGELKYYTGGVYAGKADLTAAESVGADGAATTFTENIASFFRALFVRLKGR